MSAFLCSDTHFNVLVSYFISQNGRESGLWLEVNGEYMYLNKENAGAVANILWRENVRSLEGRYGDTPADFSDYEFNYLSSVKQSYSIPEIAGAIDCLEYQSCEQEDYYTTKAYSILCLMRKYLLRELQEQELGNDTVWSIDSVKVTTRIGVL